MKKYEVILARCLVESDQRAFGARFMNPGNSDVRILKGTVIALFELESGVETSRTLLHTHVVASEDILPSHLQDMFKSNHDGLNNEEREELRKRLIKKQDDFARPSEVGRCKLGTHKIKLTDDKSLKEAPRRTLLFKRSVLEVEIKKLEEWGLIDKSDSPYSAQTMLVRKKDGTWRMCVDYSKLNAKTVKDAYPLPRIEDNIDSLAGACWFSTTDCDMAYHQIALEDSDKIKTAFTTPTVGMYHY